jgi:hypothetical protein
MAQAGYTPIQLYYSTTASAVPTAANLLQGELGLNIADGKLYYEDSGGTVQLLASKGGAAGDVVGPASATDNAIARYDGTTGKLVQNSVVTIADSTGDISGVGSLSATGATLSGLTASQAVFTDGSKVLVSNAITGTGNVVMSTSPTLVTPVLGTPTSGQLSACTVDGTDAVGFRNTPVNSQSADYTLVLADSGKTILHPVSDDNARTFTIPANSSVAYPVGTAITFVNLINTVTIAITSDTMYLAGDGATGSRTLAAYGVASAVKVASTTWIISGNGLT